ncbi:MAG TPA: hypothetical protein VN737_01525, partial [Bryobacteraceae bacterium]|nr:hypothetical protein [Bryobacteraceae bacterium]
PVTAGWPQWGMKTGSGRRHPFRGHHGIIVESKGQVCTGFRRNSLPCMDIVISGRIDGKLNSTEQCKPKVHLA